MAVPFLDAMAQAIYFYEGHEPEDRNHLNNNPGNLRATEGSSDPVDDKGYRIFPSFVEGYQALVDDLRSKLTGHDTHGLSQNSTLWSFFEVYAPSFDSNQPVIYARFVAAWLERTYGKSIVSGDSFAEMLAMITQVVV